MFTVGIVGGGKGGVEILGMVKRCANAKAAFVCDRNPEAPAMIAAHKHGIPVTTEIEGVFQHKVDVLFDLSGNPSVREQLHRELQQGTSLVDGDLAYFLFSLADANMDDEDEDTLENRYLTFKIMEEEYAIPVVFVKEIVGVPKITHIPEMPSYMKGTVNLRGIVFPVIDLRVRFGFSETQYTDRTCVVVIEFGNKSIGFIVDEVHESIEIRPENIEHPPRLGGVSGGGYVRGIGKDASGGVKIVIDVEALLKEDEVVQTFS